MIKFIFLMLLSINNGVVTVSWNPNSDDDLAGYKIYHGKQSRTYDVVRDIGDITKYVITDLESGITHFFTVTAYDMAFNESSFSDEVFIHIEPVDTIPNDTTTIKRSTKLLQNYPNPFNSSTMISYSMEGVMNHIDLRIFNIQGQQVRRLVRAYQPSGRYVKVWDGKDDSGFIMPSGVYYYRLKVIDKGIFNKKLVLLR